MQNINYHVFVRPFFDRKLIIVRCDFRKGLVEFPTLFWLDEHILPLLFRYEP